MNLEVGDVVRSRVGLCRVVELVGRRAVLDWLPDDGSGPWRQDDPEPLAELVLVTKARSAS